MTKEQVNYLLVLATLFIVWLYFNTFYVGAQRSYGGSPFRGIRTAATSRMQNFPGIPKVPEPPKMADLLKLANKTPAAPAKMTEASSEAAKAGETAKS